MSEKNRICLQTQLSLKDDLIARQAERASAAGLSGAQLHFFGTRMSVEITDARPGLRCRHKAVAISQLLVRVFEKQAKPNINNRMIILVPRSASSIQGA